MEGKSILLINAGMRKNGTSASIARTFKLLTQELGSTAEIIHILDFYQDEQSIDQLEKLINKYDITGIIIPTYVNTLPYPVILCMEYLVDRGVRFKEKGLFAIAQGGMYYLNVHQPVLDTCRHFAYETSMNWQGGVICGMAPIINGVALEKTRLIGKRMIRGFSCMLKHILLGEIVPNKVQKMFTIKIPSVFTYPLATLLNFTLKKEFKEKGITDINPRPYLK